MKTVKFIDAMYKKVFAIFRFSLTIVNDRDGQIPSMLWKRLCNRYSISIKLLSVYYLETDGQIKSANRVIKNYFWAYMNHMQENWVDNLLIAQFAMSNHINALMRMTLFFVDYSFHSWIDMEPFGIYNDEQKVKLLVADKIIKRQTKMIPFLQIQLAWAQDKQTQFANQNCQLHPEYQIDNEVYMNIKHFVLKKSKKLLNLKNARPWKISRIIDNKTYKQKILQHIKDASFTLIFHTWKLHLALNNLFPNQVLPSKPPILIQNDNNDIHNE